MDQVSVSGWSSKFVLKKSVRLALLSDWQVFIHEAPAGVDWVTFDPDVLTT